MFCLIKKIEICETLYYRYIKTKNPRGVVAHACNPVTQEAKGLQIQGPASATW